MVIPVVVDGQAGVLESFPVCASTSNRAPKSPCSVWVLELWPSAPRTGANPGAGTLPTRGGCEVSACSGPG